MPGVSVSPTLYLSLMALICIGAFLVGLRFRRKTTSPSADFGLDKVHKFGLLMMVAAPLMFVAQAALVLSGTIEIGGPQ